MFTTCVESAAQVPGRGALALSKLSSAAGSSEAELQKKVTEASETLFSKIQGYKEIMASLTPSRVALLLWTDKVLVAKAKALNIGHATVAEEVEDKELRQLLEAREAAYLTLVMGVNRWQDIMQLYEHLKKLCAILHGQPEPFMQETSAVLGKGIFKQWEQWVKALNMVPRSELFQQLYDNLPSYFQTTRQQYVMAARVASAQSQAASANVKTKAT